MDFILTKDQFEFGQEIICFSRECLNQEEYLEKYSSELFKKVANFGLLGITIAEEYGGLNETYLTAAIAFEALGYACKNNGLIFVINNHIWVAQNIIYLYGSEVLIEKYVPPMVKGEKIGALAITEAEAGSDALMMTTTAAPTSDGFLLNGSKMFISNGPIADIFIVFAVTETQPVKKITAFVVEKDFEGVKVGPNIEKMGLGFCPTSEIVFKDCKVPQENVLGHFNMGGSLFTFIIEWERFYEFVPHIGVMQRVMEQCIEQANARKQFGQSIAEYQGVSHKIADMKVAIEMSRLMMYKIACLKDQNKPAYVEASIFKLFVSENYIKTCRDALQIFGAYGYAKEYDLERELRDALASSIYSGTNEIQRNTIFKMASLSWQ
jgi:alkylation response protein AidB-like acyl-CoA dehydrogenase